VSRSQAFTLVEIVLAVFILMLLLLMAVPSVTGVLADRRLRQSLDRFNKLVNQAHEHSVGENRPYLVVFGTKSIELRPEVFGKDDEPAPVAELPLAIRDAVKLSFPAALTKNPPAEWIFWPSGTCEPAVVNFVSPNGEWTADYSALNSRPEIVKYVPR
jgi:type II secretory pathway pseudopilin PulG